MATKKPKVSIYLPPELKEELDTWAEEENRSVSNLVETVIRDALAARRKKFQSSQSEGQD
uniref:Ribbon-helix-helix protein, CopG family n=1 Tax=Desmonostoc muscorum LEGE 12446 TaxID=1828758 RepID=A0A8J6ZLW2_DESMC